MIGERDVRLDAEKYTSGEKSIWRGAFIISCDATYRYIPTGLIVGWTQIGKKHYPLKAHHIKHLITYIEKGRVLEGHKDIPETVHDELYREEQEKQKRQGKDKCKGDQVIGTDVPYSFCNIYNVLPSQSIVQDLYISDPKAAVEQMALSPLEIPGPRDVAVKKYSEWQISNVENDTLKSAFRQVCNVILDNSLDLEQIYKDQDPKFFIEKGIKIGIARCFVEDIGKWAEQVKKAITL